ncbi:MAG: thioesterase family protein [Candidatus Methylomirabilis sp.]
MEPEINSTASAELIVAESDLATALDSDLFPAVFATSRMVALMELAAARLLQPLLRPGELSVGATLDISHTAATPPGIKVIATARYLGRDGKLFLFEVVAGDQGGEIGRGTHKRAIVSTERLLSGAARRTSGA